MNRSQRFSHRVAIVTGAATGIGYEIVRRLLEEGAYVLMNDINAEITEEAIAKLSKHHPGKLTSYCGDAGDISVIREMVKWAVKKFGRLDLLVANAGITLFGDFFEFTPAEFQTITNLNLQGTFFLVQTSANQMRIQGTGGRIVLMSSVVGMRAGANLAAYAMTKSAISTLASALVPELSPHQIYINALAPGATLTERTEQETPDYAGTWGRLIPTGKVALPGDIADATLFLLSQDARHITGQTLVVDGGWTQIGKTPESNENEAQPNPLQNNHLPES